MKNKIIIGLFCLMLFGLTVWSLLKPDASLSARENRVLAQKPEWSAASFFDGTFTTAYEEYITDQFPARDGWVSLKVLVEKLSGKKDTNEVYFSKDGYLQEKFPAADYEAEQAMTNREALAVFLETMQAQLGEDSVSALLVPGSASVMSDKLPDMAEPYPELEELDEWREQMPALLDVGTILQESGEEYLYYMTDHHWTTKGAYIAYTAWAAQMGLTPVSEAEFQWETLSEDFQGTVYSKAGTLGTARDTILAPVWPNQKITVEYDMSGQSKDSLYERSHLETQDQYAVFLDRNHGLVDIHTDVDNGRTLLLVKDSFANCYVPFAMQHYERVLVVDLRYFNMPLSSYVTAEEVDDVCLLYHFHNFITDRNVFKLTR